MNMLNAEESCAVNKITAHLLAVEKILADSGPQVLDATVREFDRILEDAEARQATDLAVMREILL